MNWKEQFTGVLNILIGTLVGLMIYAWVAEGSPWKVDWVFGSIMFLVLMLGRGIRVIWQRTETSESKAPNE
jgi:hypothetical protein